MFQNLIANFKIQRVLLLLSFLTLLLLGAQAPKQQASAFVDSGRQRRRNGRIGDRHGG